MTFLYLAPKCQELMSIYSIPHLETKSKKQTQSV